MIKNKLSKYINYFYIFIFILVGSGIFYGMTSTGNLMRTTAENYLKKFDLEDVRIYASHGIDEDDMKLISQNVDVSSIALGYQMDANIDASGKLISLESIPESWVKHELVSGEFPKKSGEIAIDASLIGNEYKLGDKISLSTSSENPRLMLKTRSFTIVGFISSPEYIINSDKGYSPEGAKLDGYALILPKDFDIKYENFVRIHMASTNNLSRFSSLYQTIVDQAAYKLMNAFKDVPKVKAEKVKKEAKEQIEKSNQNIKDLNAKKDKYLKDIDDLDASIKTGDIEFNKSQDKFNKLVQKSNETLKNGAQKIKDLEEKQKKEEDNSKKIQTKIDELTKTVASQQAEVDKRETAYASRKGDVEARNAEINNSINSVAGAISNNEGQTSKLKGQLTSLKLQLIVLPINKKSIEKQIKDVEGSIARLAAEKKSLTSKLSDLRTNKQAVDNELAQVAKEAAEIKKIKTALNEQKANLTKEQTNLSKSKGEIEKNTKAIQDAKKDLEDAKNFISKDKAKMEKALEDDKKKLDDNKSKLEKDLKEKDSVLAQNAEDIKREKLLIDISNKELEGKILPVYTTVSQTENAGMKLYSGISKRIDMITLIIPSLIFLVCLVFTYRLSKKILDKLAGESTGGSYKLFYKIILPLTALAVASGVAAGFFGISQPVFRLYSKSFAFTTPALTIFPICALVVALLVYLVVLLPIYFKKHPIGKWQEDKTFDQSLERKNIIKNELFSKKLTLIGLVIAILISSATLLGSMSIKRSINDIAAKQYDEIIKYNAIAKIASTAEDKQYNELNYFLKEIKEARSIEDLAMIKAESIKENFPNQGFNLLVVKNPKNIGSIISIKDKGKEVELTDQNFLISRKLMELLNLKAGDEITFKVSSNKILKAPVQEGFDNYIGNYGIISQALYKNISKEDIRFNYKSVILKDSSDYAEKNFLNEISEYAYVNQVATSKADKESSLKLIVPLNYLQVINLVVSSLLLIVSILLSTYLVSKKRYEKLKISDNDKLTLKEILKEANIIVFISVSLGLGLGSLINYITQKIQVADNIFLVSSYNPFDYMIVFFGPIILSWFISTVVEGRLIKDEDDFDDSDFDDDKATKSKSDLDHKTTDQSNEVSSDFIDDLYYITYNYDESKDN